jgi:glycosyltransferase involved in cell wall biosynthesis
MAEHGAWDVLDLPAEQLPELARGVARAPLVLMDSIWLTEAHAGAFLALAGSGQRVGAMLHSFPSLIAATESGREPLLQPSRFEIQTLQALSCVVVPGRHYADMLAEHALNIVVAEPGIDPGWRAPPRHRQGPCRLVSVGAVTPRKGFLDVAAVLERRDRRDYSWTVVGSLEVDPDYAAQLVARTPALGDVVLTGQRSPGEAQRIVRGSDVLVMPSYDENQPLVLVEAMAASVPAVTYAAGATRHMLEHGRQGLIAEVGDKQELSEHLNRLLDDEALRYGMAVACWERQGSIPSWSDAAARVEHALLRSDAGR